jgi:hypothetical protein
VWDDINLGIETGMAAVVWGVGLIACGVGASLLFVRWRIMLGYTALIGAGLVLGWHWDVLNAASVYLPTYTIAVFSCGLPLVEIYRRSHRYVLTNLRVLLRGGVLRVKERTLRYEKITDIDASQTLLGKIFGFGTIIPITHSGFGMGDDESFAAVGAGTTPQKRVGFFGFVGGSRGVKTPRTRSYYELHGVYPYGDIRTLLESMVQQNTLAPYQREQIDIQREILNALRDDKA